MKTLPIIYASLPVLLLGAFADEAPVFHVTKVNIVPPVQAQEAPVLRKDEESGEPAPPLIISAEALINAKQFENIDLEDDEEDVPFEGTALLGPKSIVSHFTCELVAANGKTLSCNEYLWGICETGVLQAEFEADSDFPIQEEYTLRGNLEYTDYAETHRRWYTDQTLRMNAKQAVTIGGFQARLYSQKKDDGRLGYYLEVKATKKLTISQLTNLVYKDNNGTIWRKDSHSWTGKYAVSFLYTDTASEQLIVFELPVGSSESAGTDGNAKPASSGELIIEVETYAKGTQHKHKIDQKIRLLN